MAEIAAIGISIGLNLLAGLFQPDIEQKAPEPNLRTTQSKFNAPIPLLYGEARIGSNTFFPDDINVLYEVETKKKTSGGKGGGPKVTTEEKTVFATFASLFCQNTTAIQKLYLNGKEIEVGGDFYNEYVTFFDGTQTTPWSEIQAKAGANFDQIAYKDISYVAFTRLNVSTPEFGGQKPQQIDAVLVDTRFGSNPTLDQVVGDLCERSGLDPSEFDVTDLATTVIREGLIINESSEGGYRRAIEQLMQFYLFTAFENLNGVIEFKLYDRGTSPPITVLTETDLFPYSAEGVREQLFIKTTTPEQDLPNKITISFIDKEERYEKNDISEQFEFFTKENNINVDCGLTSWSKYVRRQARLILNYNFASRRNTYRFKTSMATIGGSVDLLDIIQLPNGDQVQVQQINPTDEYCLEIEARLYNPEINYDFDIGTPVLKSGNGFGNVNYIPVYIVDTYRFSNYNPGTYYCFAEEECVVEYSLQADFSGSVSHEHRKPSVIGNIDTALSAVASEDAPNSDTVDITLISGEVFTASNYAPSGIPLTEFKLSQNNLALIGRKTQNRYEGELLQFGTVTNLGGNSYRLSDLRRGLFRSFQDSEHSIGDFIFVFKDEPGIAYFSTLVQNADFLGLFITLNQPVYFRAITSNYQDLGITPVEAVVPGGNAFKPSAPTNFAETQDVSNNVKFTWDYDGTGFSEYNDGLNNVTYEVDIIQAAVVQRTISTTTTEAIYTSADRVSDGVTFPFDAVVYAVSEVVGRGFPSATLTVTEDLAPPPDENFEQDPNTGIIEVDYNIETLAGTKFINNASEPYQYLDPDNSDRVIDFALASSLDKRIFYIYNESSNSNLLLYVDGIDQSFTLKPSGVYKFHSAGEWKITRLV